MDKIIKNEEVHKEFVEAVNSGVVKDSELLYLLYFDLCKRAKALLESNYDMEKVSIATELLNVADKLNRIKLFIKD